MNMLKHLFLVGMLTACSVSLHATTSVEIFVEPFNYNGIYYDLTSDSTAAVINCSGCGVEDNWYEYYKGTVNIPSTISYGGKTYAVTEVENEAFRGQGGLTMVVIPKSVAKICYRAFWGCAGLKAIAFASEGNLTTIEYEAFYGSAITSLSLPNSLRSIGNDAFRYCESLKSIKGGDSVEVFGDNIFQGCKSLTEVTFPKSLKKIGDYAFWGCDALRTVIMNDGLEEIGNDAFLECSSLESVSISNTVKKIGWEAFRWCLNLRSIVIPNSVEEMGYGIFRYCTGLENVTLSNSLKIIPALAFEQTALKKIEIPNSVTIINAYAFRSCANLADVKWGNSLESIGEQAFLSTNLVTLNLPTPLKELGRAAFSECANLTTVSIPQTVITISDYAFEQCGKLKTVYNFALTPQDISHALCPFHLCDNPVEVHIYEGLKEKYETAIGWAVAIEKGNLLLKDDIPVLKVESITINNTPINCKIDETGTATATIYPSNAYSKELSWSSSDESILYIDEFSGMYIGLAQGTVTITATATDGSGVSASAIVNVTDGAGIYEVTDSNNLAPTVYVANGEIIVNGDADVQIAVYNINGGIIYYGENRPVAVANKGVYIVVGNGVATKVVL